MQNYFVIVGAKDKPLYELEATKSEKHLNQFIAHSSLDIIDNLLFNSPSLYLKVIDKFNEWNVSAYVTYSGIKFILVHDQNSDSVKSFFIEVHEAFLKVMMNPFYVFNSAITNQAFDIKVRSAIKRCFGV